MSNQNNIFHVTPAKLCQYGPEMAPSCYKEYCTGIWNKRKEPGSIWGQYNCPSSYLGRPLNYKALDFGAYSDANWENTMVSDGKTSSLQPL